MKVTYFVRMTAMPGKAEEVKAALLENFEIVQNDASNVVFALHQGIDSPDEFWVYETWESEEAVAAHEASAPFLAYKQKIKPLVDGGSVLWGNTHAFATNGY